MDTEIISQPPTRERRLLRIGEAAEYLRVSVPFLRKRKHLGLDPAHSKIGDLIIYCIDDLNKFVDSNKVQAKAA